MRAVIQRVARASVTVGASEVGAIGRGFLILLGVHINDTVPAAEALASKIAKLRLFEDGEGKINLPLDKVGGEVLVISQFTLYGDTNGGNRPSFITAARPDTAIPLYERFIAVLRENGLKVETGVFGAHMAVSLINDGPVTIIMDA